jgi:phenylalanyl-tRNA synthetase beta chain
MKISLKWLQTYFDEPLPSAEEIADAYTFHAFEIDEMQGDMLDVKVLPNRAADCLSHRGLAKELSAILDIPLKTDPLRDPLESMDIVSPYLKVEIEDPKKCLRYMGAVVKGVKVGPSPSWLKEALEAVGQRSINNVVDATNYVMLNVGQPLHAFDAKKLIEKDGKYAIGIRNAKEGEKLTTLSGEEYPLTPNIQLITDANADTPIALAGVKGGKAAELTSETTDIVVESANFNGTTTRRAAQALKLFTDASLRFQNRPSPELAAYGMRDVLKLIIEIAGGEVAGIVDEYPARPMVAPVSVSHTRINSVLGASFTVADIEEVFRRLRLDASVENDVFTVTPPFERTDLVIAEDLVEEVGRIIGYDKLAPTELPLLATAPDQARFRGMERMKDQLVEQGFIEVSTQSFAKKGDVMLANPLDKGMPALRTTLEDNLKNALEQAKYVAPLVLAPNQKPKLFEVGTVFPKSGEFVELRMTETVPAWGEDFPTFDNLSIAKLEDYGKDYTPARYELGTYQPFSVYPFITRDISMWITDSPEARGIVFKLFGENGAPLLRQVQLLDQFTNKEGRQSLAFRLIFQSFERTLTDDEVNTIMTNITSAVTTEGYEVR